MRINEARRKGKEIAFISGIVYREVDYGAFQEYANIWEWSDAEAELVYEQYLRALDRIEKFLQI